MINGYEDSPLVDGTPFLSDPLFWPTYFSDTMASSEPERVAEAFEVDEAACVDYYVRRLVNREAWPVFRIGLRDGHDAYVVYRNVPGDKTTEFVLCRPGGAHPLELANIGGARVPSGPELGRMISRRGSWRIRRTGRAGGCRTTAFWCATTATAGVTRRAAPGTRRPICGKSGRRSRPIDPNKRSSY